MSTQVNIHEAKTRFSALIRQVRTGESIIIASNGRPVARLSPVDEFNVGPRRPGTAQGSLVMGENFDAPLPEDLISDFE